MVCFQTSSHAGFCLHTSHRSLAVIAFQAAVRPMAGITTFQELPSLLRANQQSHIVTTIINHRCIEFTFAEHELSRVYIAARSRCCSCRRRR
uniref:Uncharacterized protein n=1 Tax=Hyaloperonospora arabidopsidis (strain Emoy2) TaxID=559515 RepID=M4B4N2_HYAAE